MKASRKSSKAAPARRAARTRKPRVAKTTIIRQKALIPGAKPAEVYEAFVNEVKHTTFTGAKATCERKIGGKFSAWDGYIIGTNVVLEAGKRLVQEWQTTGWPAGYPPSLIEFTFSSKDGGTEIRMVQKKVPPKQAPGYREGWKSHYWEPLKQYFEK
jgi:activator of HSP90 ATPase